MTRDIRPLNADEWDLIAALRARTPSIVRAQLARLGYSDAPPRAEDGTELVFVTASEAATLRVLRLPETVRPDSGVVLAWIRATHALLAKDSGADLLLEVAKQVEADR